MEASKCERRRHPSVAARGFGKSWLPFIAIIYCHYLLHAVVAVDGDPSRSNLGMNCQMIVGLPGILIVGTNNNIHMYVHV